MQVKRAAFVRVKGSKPYLAGDVTEAFPRPGEKWLQKPCRSCGIFVEKPHGGAEVDHEKDCMKDGGIYCWVIRRVRCGCLVPLNCDTPKI